MKVIQSYIPFNSPKRFDPKKDEMYINMLSTLLINKHYGSSTLYTNDTCKLIFNQIGIPYTKIDTKVLAKEPAKAFALPKLLAMKEQTEPFLHLDLDSLVLEAPTFPEQPFIFSHVDQPAVKEKPKKERLTIANMFNRLNEDGWYLQANNAYYRFVSYFLDDLINLNFPLHYFDASTIPNMNIIKVEDTKMFTKAINKALEVYNKVIAAYDTQAPWEISCFIEQGCIHAILRELSPEYERLISSEKDTYKHVLFADDPIKSNFYKSLESGEITHESIPPFPLKFSHQAFCNSCNQTHSMHHSILSEQDLIENLNLDKFKFWHIGGINKTIAWIQAMVIGHLVKHFGVEEALKINSWFRDDRISKGYKPTLSPGEKMYEKLSGTDIFTSNWKKTLF